MIPDDALLQLVPPDTEEMFMTSVTITEIDERLRHWPFGGTQ
ncbi:MAG: hypothetical protein AAGF95_06495 [Chloroflexota bacterium]